MASSDLIADLAKNTELLGTEGAANLKEFFDATDTRTSTADLLKLATVFGKLGEDGVENIRGLTLAANKLNIILGDDLSAGADEVTRTIAKVVKVLDADKEFGLEGALVRVGSAINEVTKSSTASADSIVDFLGRVAGVGQLGKISADELVALGGTLDALTVSAEVSGTSFQRFFLQFGKAKNFEAFGKTLGISAEEFAELLDTQGLFKTFTDVIEAA